MKNYLNLSIILLLIILPFELNAQVDSAINRSLQNIFARSTIVSPSPEEQALDISHKLHFIGNTVNDSSLFIILPVGIDTNNNAMRVVAINPSGNVSDTAASTTFVEDLHRISASVLLSKYEMIYYEFENRNINKYFSVYYDSVANIPLAFEYGSLDKDNENSQIAYFVDLSWAETFQDNPAYTYNTIFTGSNDLKLEEIVLNNRVVGFRYFCPRDAKQYSKIFANSN